MTLDGTVTETLSVRPTGGSTQTSLAHWDQLAHSIRRAVAGLMRTARVAGTTAAMSTVPSSPVDANPNAEGSVGSIPYNRLSSTRESKTDAMMPPTMPEAAAMRASRTTS